MKHAAADDGVVGIRPPPAWGRELKRQIGADSICPRHAAPCVGA